MALVKLVHDPKQNIVFVTFPPVRLETRDDISDMFEAVLGFWRKHCENRKVYYVVDFTGYSFNVVHTDFYATWLRRVIRESAITIVRFGGDELQRAATRVIGIKTHTPSRLYKTREEALAVVRAIQSGTVAVEPS